MTYGVFVLTDASGSWPVIIGPDTRVGPAAAGVVRYRLIAQTDDIEEARRLRAQLHEQRERGELSSAVLDPPVHNRAEVAALGPREEPTAGP